MSVQHPDFAEGQKVWVNVHGEEDIAPICCAITADVDGALAVRVPAGRAQLRMW